MTTFLHGFERETAAVIRAMTTVPNTTRRRLYDVLIRDLKAGGAWAKLDALYIIAAHEAAAALINIRSPGTFTASLSSAPTFVADQGYTGDGTDDFFNSNFNPTSAAGLFSLNSAHMGAWVRTNVAEDRYVAGPSSTSGAQTLAVINPRLAADGFVGRINDATNFTAASTNSIGHWIANRSGASAREFYKDGASIGSDTVAATALNNTGLVALKGSSQFSTRQVSAFHFGSSLSAGEADALYDALAAYVTGL